MRAQRTGNRYLAALVIAAAVLHSATVIVATALLWAHRNRELLALDLAVLGILPAIFAIVLALRAWSAAGGQSAAWSCGGLLILLAAMAIAHGRAGAL